MTTIERLDKDLLDYYRKEVVPDTLEKHGIYEILRKKSGNPYRITENEIKVSKALEDTLAIYLTMEDQNKRGELLENLKGNEEDKKKFVNAYSLFAGTSKGLWLLDKNETRSIDTAMGVVSDNEIDEIKIYHYLVLEYKDLISKDKGKIYDLTASYLDSVKRECEKKKEKYPGFVDRVEKLRIEENGFVLEGFESNPRINGIEFEKVSFDEIVGNREAKSVLKTSIDKLFFYDPIKEENFIKEISSLPTSILLYGDPGGGKTLLLKATATYAAEKAKKLKKPLEVVTIDDRIRSKYHGESSKELRKRFARATDPKKIGLLYVEDIESLFPSRKELEDEPEDKDTFRTFINMIQGLESMENRGNYIIIATTNFPEAQDDALAQRFNMHIKVTGPETLEDYINITRLHLEKYINKEKISVEDWERIGAEAKKRKLSGRDINNLTKNLALVKCEVDITDDLYSMDPEQAKKKILSKMDEITDEDIIEEIERYYKSIKDEEERARKMKIESLVKRRRLELEAEKILGGKK
ncbi:MAG: ATP-binding protein [Candidatus Aenigmarchaeota archaeon]|nr:ATP-binding protein [Candidatus Aenigmarchaeota archaeon]